MPTILWLDDLSEVSVSVIHQVELATGAEVITARTCAEFEARIAQPSALQPDLVIADLRLPDGSGVDALHALRSSNAVTPVLVFSAFPESLPAGSVAALGIAAVCSKVADAGALVERARALLGAAGFTPPQYPPPESRVARLERGLLRVGGLVGGVSTVVGVAVGVVAGTVAAVAWLTSRQSEDIPVVVRGHQSVSVRSSPDPSSPVVTHLEGGSELQAKCVSIVSSVAWVYVADSGWLRLTEVEPMPGDDGSPPVMDPC